MNQTTRPFFYVTKYQERRRECQCILKEAKANNKTTMDGSIPPIPTPNMNAAAPRVATQQCSNYQPTQHPNSNIQQVEIAPVNNETPTQVPNVAAIPQVTDPTEVSTLSSNISNVYFNYDNAANRHNLMNVIKTDIFRKYKYVRSNDDLEFSTDDYSLAQMILNSLNVTEDNLIRQTCWRQIRYLVAKNLNLTLPLNLTQLN